MSSPGVSVATSEEEVVIVVTAGAPGTVTLVAQLAHCVKGSALRTSFDSTEAKLEEVDHSTL